MLRKNGTRQPQVAKSAPVQALTARITRFDRNRPDGTPNCGQDATSPRLPWLRAHSIEISTDPPHSPPTPMPWSMRSTVRMTAPQAPTDS